MVFERKPVYVYFLGSVLSDSPGWLRLAPLIAELSYARLFFRHPCLGLLFFLSGSRKDIAYFGGKFEALHRFRTQSNVNSLPSESAKALCQRPAEAQALMRELQVTRLACNFPGSSQMGAWGYGVPPFLQVRRLWGSAIFGFPNCFCMCGPLSEAHRNQPPMGHQFSEPEKNHLQRLENLCCLFPKHCEQTGSNGKAWRLDRGATRGGCSVRPHRLAQKFPLESSMLISTARGAGNGVSPSDHGGFVTSAPSTDSSLALWAELCGFLHIELRKHRTNSQFPAKGLAEDALYQSWTEPVQRGSSHGSCTQISPRDPIPRSCAEILQRSFNRSVVQDFRQRS